MRTAYYVRLGKMKYTQRRFTLGNASGASLLRAQVPSTVVFSKLFAAFVEIDNLGTPSKTSNGSQFVLVMMDCCSEITRAALTFKTTARNIVSLFMDVFTTLYWIINHKLTKNRAQSIRKFFETLCKLLGTKPLKITAYFVKTSG